MTQQEAIHRLYEKYTEKPTIMRIAEFGICFGFFITVPNANKRGKNFIGGNMICISKNSGDIYDMAIADVDFSKVIRWEVPNV